MIPSSQYLFNLFVRLDTRRCNVCVTNCAERRTIAKAKEDLAEILCRAHLAGMAAGNAVVPESMVTAAWPTLPQNRRTYHVPDGVRGFAWVTIRPGSCAAAKYAKKHFHAARGYHGGVEVWVSAFGQSMDRKYAYAKAFAAVLRAAGIRAYAYARTD